MPALPSIDSPIRFGVFEVDFRSGELRKRGTRIRLQEKPLQILSALLARAGTVVSRQELRESIWPDESFGDFEHSLNIAVTKLRQALGDAAANPRFIETLPRHGYRFIAPVALPPAPIASGAKAMLAVLPFENLSNSPDEDYFSDGLTEEMIAELGRIQPARLGVIARTTVMAYRNSGKTVAEIGRELGVSFVLEGSVRRSSTHARITAQLIQVSDQTHLWANTYDRAISDLLDIQRSIAKRIARSLAIELLPPATIGNSRAGSRNTQAHEAYLQGRHFWSLRTETGFRLAIENFQNAIRLDPEFALAYAGLADAFNTIGLYGGIPPVRAKVAAQEAARKALTLDDKLAEAHASLAYSYLLYDWDWEASERSFLNAVQFNPNYVTGHHWFALLHTVLGRSREAILRMDQGLSLDPLSPVLNCHKGWILYFARRYDEALAQIRYGLSLGPRFALGHYFQGLIHLRQGSPEEAARSFVEADSIWPAHPSVVAGLGIAEAAIQGDQRARAALDQLSRLRSSRLVSPFYSALVYVALRDFDQAIASLEMAHQERCGWIAHILVEPALDPLRTHPRFRQLLTDIGFPQLK
jgi:TolB-like protein/Flp pilus assembly protein TadD